MNAAMFGARVAGAWATVVTTWTFEPLVVLPIVVAAALYCMGVVRVLRRRGRTAWRRSRSVCFLAGIVVLFVALASPIDSYADSRLSVHMVQHLLLTLIAPPLLLLGRPVTLAYAAGSRRTQATLAAVARSGVARALGSPVIGFAAFAIAVWASHFTSLYETALTDDGVHALEHVLYVSTAMLFWWPVVARDPGAGRLSHPARAFYLFVNMPVMSLLGFVVSSAHRVLYPAYELSSGSAASALADQRLAGTIMWESSMLVSVAALSAVLIDWMRREEIEARRSDARLGHRAARAPGPPVDVEVGEVT